MADTTYNFDFLDQRRGRFALWVPGRDLGGTPPQLILGTYDTANHTFTQVVHSPLSKDPVIPDVWELDPNSSGLGLSDGVYHYWFEIEDSSPENRGKLLVTDPFAYTVDYRQGLVRGQDEWIQPAAVIKLRDGQLWPCDVDGTGQHMRFPSSLRSSHSGRRGHET